MKLSLAAIRANRLHTLAPEMQGIIYMICGAFWFTTMTAIVRHISADIHPFQVVFFRNAFALLLLLPWALRIGLKSLNTTRMGLYVWRGCNGFVAMLLWFSALSILPLPTAISLSFTAPLFTVLAAMFFLKEKVGWHRLTALVIGFLGTLVILRPGGEGFHYAFLLALIASALWAISNIIIKRLTTTESPNSIVFYMVLIMTPISLPFALYHWESLSLVQYGWLLLLAFVSNKAQMSISHAYGKADMSILQPFDFFRLVFASFIAYFAFGEIIDRWTLIGAVVIMTSTVYITHREARIKRRQKALIDNSIV